MDRRGSGRWRCALLLAPWFLAAGCATRPQAPGRIGPAGLVAPHRVGFEVSTIGDRDPHTPAAALLPGISVGLRHRLTGHLAGGVTLFFSGEAAVDVKAAMHLGPRLVVSLDPRVVVGQLLWVSTPDLCNPSVAPPKCGSMAPPPAGTLPAAGAMRR